MNHVINKQKEWDQFFIKMARFVASKSKDESTKCGCIITKDNRVLSTGYNGLPKGTEYDEDKQKRPAKYFYFEHSERNALYSAAKHGIILQDATAYVTGTPCADCARGLIQSGIIRIVIPKKPAEGRVRSATFDERWAESMTKSKEMLNNAAVSLEEIVLDEV